jgi:hypothetical protein
MTSLLTESNTLVILRVLLIYLCGPSKAHLTFRQARDVYALSDRKQI